MNIREVLIGLTLVVVSILAFRFSLPRDGQVRSFLRNDTVQSYYTVVLLGAFAIGLVNIVTGLAP